MIKRHVNPHIRGTAFLLKAFVDKYPNGVDKINKIIDTIALVD
jgi:hypothetical protein